MIKSKDGFADYLPTPVNETSQEYKEGSTVQLKNARQMFKFLKESTDKRKSKASNESVNLLSKTQKTEITGKFSRILISLGLKKLSKNVNFTGVKPRTSEVNSSYQQVQINMFQESQLGTERDDIQTYHKAKLVNLDNGNSNMSYQPRNPYLEKN